MSRLLRSALLLALAAEPAVAQGVQNSDIFFVAGASLPTKLSGAQFSMSEGYGYQIVRKSAASLWAEMAIAFGSGGTLSWFTYTPGLRFMVPLHERVSIYGAAGGGAGHFRYPSAPHAIDTWHGVFDFGGGVDIRLKRGFSLRAESRDFVTGRNLSGFEGRHHPVTSIGIAFHH